MGHDAKHTTPNSTDNLFGIPEGLVAKRRNELIQAKKFAFVAISQENVPLINLSELAQAKEITPLTHLTLSRPIFPHRPPSHQTRQIQGSKEHFFAGSKESNNEENNSDLNASSIDLVKKAIKDAKDHYEKRYQTGLDPRHTPGWLTNWRHGPGGLIKAEDICEKTKNFDSINSIIIELTNFLLNPNTRYNNNSFAPYLLDELNCLLQRFSLPESKPVEGKPYNKILGLLIVSQLKKIESIDAVNCTNVNQLTK